MRRTFEIETLTLSFGALLILGLLFFMAPGAHAASIKCETNYGLKSFSIEDNTIAFNVKNQGRTISSVHQAKTLKTAEGISKTLYVDGKKHFIKIADLNNPSDLNDYMAITSPEGHKMTYPLTCKVI